MNMLTRFLGVALLALGSAVSRAAYSATLPRVCPVEIPAQGVVESSVPEHRLAPSPTIRYPYGAKVPERWGFSVMFKVDASGRVECFAVDRFAEGPSLQLRTVKLTPARREAIARLASAGYRPFLRDGVPAPATIADFVREEELPQANFPLPEVPLDAVVITLWREGCYEYSCAHYSVRIRGDGAVRYEGLEHADVAGVQEYGVPVDRVRDLVDSLRVKDLWSLRPEYRSDWRNPTFKIELKLGDKAKQIVDVSGRDVGMPAAVTEFENEIDEVAMTRLWDPISLEGVERLRAQGFEFSSPNGAALLQRVFDSGGTKDNAAIIRMLELGAPAATSVTFTIHGEQTTRTVLEAAASQCHREGVVESLLAHGALDVDVEARQARVNRAFQNAIGCGMFAPVRAIWEAAGKGSLPEEVFRGKDPRGNDSSRNVILMLEKDAVGDAPWEGFKIARWLAEEGWDLHVSDADGRNLMDVAVGADDPDFVRFLLQQGFDASAPGQHGDPPLAGAYSESVALLLLEAGAKAAEAEETPGDFLAMARKSGWTKVVARMEAQGEPKH